MKDYRVQLFLSVFILLALLTGACTISVHGEASSIPNPSVLDKVVDAQPYLWFLREEINERITCESGILRYIGKDEDELPNRVHVYYHVVEYKDRIYVLYVYHWLYSIFFSVHVGLGRIEVGNHCWDYEPVIVVLDKDWTSLYAVYDAGHYDTEKVMAARSDTIELQVVKGTHYYAPRVDTLLQYSYCHTFPKNRFIPLTIDKIFDWQKQLQLLPPYGPHDLSLLDAYLFPWAVGPDSKQIDAFSHEISAYTWNDLYAVGGARLFVRQVYPYAQYVLDKINSLEVNIFKNAFNNVLENLGLVTSAKNAVNKYGVGPANVLTMDPKYALEVGGNLVHSFDMQELWKVFEWSSYLSDIQESSVQVGWGSFHKDMFSKRGETRAFILDGKTYQKGLDTHAPAHVIYNLNGQFKRFQSSVGLWDSGNPDRGVPGDFAGNRGSVRFIVVLDGQQVYDSGVMRWDTPAKSIDIDVSGAQILELRVMDVEDLAYDWSIWADAKLLK